MGKGGPEPKGGRRLELGPENQCFEGRGPFTSCCHKMQDFVAVMLQRWQGEAKAVLLYMERRASTCSPESRRSMAMPDGYDVQSRPQVPVDCA